MTDNAEQRLDRIEALSRRVNTLDQQVRELGERVDQQQYVIDQLVTDLPTQTLSKREKKFRIIQRAVKDSASKAIAHTLERGKVAGTADCSDRHARTLMKELGETYEWAEYDPNGRPAKLHIDYGDDSPDEFLDRVSEAFPEVDR